MGLVLKVNPQLHCCYQNQSIKHTHRKILSKIFLLFRKKRKYAKAFIPKNGLIKKTLATVVYYDNICNIIVKVRDRFIQNPALQFPAVLHTVSLLSKQMFSNMLPNINVTKRHNSVSIQQVRSYVHSIKTENQIDWLKKNSMRKKLSKNTSDSCCRTNKAGIQNQLFAEEEFWPQNYNFSSKKSFWHQGKVVSRKRQGQADLGQNKLKRYTGEHLPI